MEEWKEYKLGDICTKIGSGATPKGGKEAYLGGNISLIRSQNVLDFTFSEDGLANINDEQANKLKNVEVKENDVLLNITGDSVARACIVPNTILPARVNQHVTIIRGDNSVILNEFILYALQYKKQYLLSISQGGGTRNALTKKMIEDFMIKLPSLPSQQKIANILSSLDDKIEVNRRINEQLEELAGALFKSWFVDFEPFKDGEFVDSELGMIPKGWKVGDIYEHMNVIYGAPYKSSVFNDKGDGLPLIRIRDLKTNAPQFYTPEILPNTEYVNIGDVVAGMDAEFVPYIWLGAQGVLNQRCCKFVAKDKKISNYYIINTVKPKLEFVQSYKTGTTVSHLGKSDIDRFRVVNPPLNIVADFSEKVNPLLVRKIALAEEIHHLTTLRDTLLPKLMSGEIDVNEVKI